MRGRSYLRVSLLAALRLADCATPPPAPLHPVQGLGAPKRDDGRFLAHLGNGDRVRFLDIGAHFLRNGQIPPEIMPDQLHPSRAGCAIWAETMQPLPAQLLAAR